MSDQEFETYLTLIGRFLRLSSTQRAAIGEELRDHFESRLTELMGHGISREEAVRLALEEFGDAAGLAAQFYTIAQTRKRRLIMRCTAISAGVLTATILTAMALWPDRHAGPPIGNLVAHAADAKTNDQSKEIPGTTLAQDLTAETQSKLKNYLSVELVETPLKDFFTFVSDQLGVQIYAKQSSLGDEGVGLDTPISVHLSHVRGEMLLDLVLKELNLGFTIRDGIVIVTTPKELSNTLEIRVYDCRNLLSADDILGKGPQQLLKLIPQPPPGGVTIVTPASRLIDVVCNTVNPTSWGTADGPGTICEYNGLLVVSQTSDVHGKVATLLEELSRKLGATAIQQQSDHDEEHLVE